MALQHHFYDAQVRRYLLQVVRMFSGFTVKTGKKLNDGVTDYYDNCYNVRNADQQDVDGDGIGDVCDDVDDRPDEDEDGIIDEEDNCPRTPNEDQADHNNNGIGEIPIALFQVLKDDSLLLISIGNLEK